MTSMDRLKFFAACALSAAVTFSLCGCNKTPVSPPTSTGPAAAGSMTGGPSVGVAVPTLAPTKARTLSVGEKLEADGITLTVQSPAGVEAFVKENKGKVVLVDFWATWCAPCLKSFPHTVEMQHKYGEKGFVAASMCMMEPEDDTMKQAHAKLKELKADIANFMSAPGGDDPAYEAFKITLLPHYRIYDRDGKVVANLDNSDVNKPIDHTDVEKEVRKQLGLPSSK